ncbi:MAG: ATP-binding cassette domain-containing protein [Rhodospirillales bacterium]|nr:ATP-binding cassette domain-containing protein [Rhodospirillales bacterium]MBO6788399.1 ATP-binding cassette domain-containing protein [Rhodospirillales bacterium]
MLIANELARAVLQPTSLEVEDGECVSIRGASGSGKSLLLRAIADLDPCTGRISLDGVDRDSMPANEWRRRVTYVAADSGWWTDRVADHFEFPDIAAGYLVRLGFQGDVMSWPVSRLSTGERQRLALLRAMVQGPRVLLLDEPTSALDPETTAKVESLLHEKILGGIIVIMVTHDAGQAKRMARRSFRMKDGRLSEEAA